MKLAQLITSGIIALTMASNSTAGDHSKHLKRSSYKTVVVDVACDARTYAATGLENVAAEGEEPDLQEVRGSTFIVNGIILPGYTIPKGDGFDFDAAAKKSRGKWVCRGTYNFSLAEIFGEAEEVPHVSTTQHYLFGKKEGLVQRTMMVSEGNEGGATTHRAITGGTGKYRGVIGEVKQEFLGLNSTGFENFRFTFKVKIDR